MNAKMTGTGHAPAPLGTFLNSIFTIARHWVTDFVVIEYGPRWRRMIAQYGEQAGLTYKGLANIKYANGKGGYYPLDLHMFSKGGLGFPEGYEKAVHLTHGYRGTLAAVRPLVDDVRFRRGCTPIVLDPCCGMGYTGQTAIDTLSLFRGNEVNRKRLGKTLKRFDDIPTLDSTA